MSMLEDAVNIKNINTEDSEFKIENIVENYASVTSVENFLHKKSHNTFINNSQNENENNDINKNEKINNENQNNNNENNNNENNDENYNENFSIPYSLNSQNSIIEAPINLIEFTKTNFILNEKALEILKNIKENIIVVSIVGKARTGKSYLMNLLLNNNNSKNNNENSGNGFKVSPSLNSCTRGIWLWNTPKQKPNSSSKIIFIDSEGTNSIDISTKTYDSKIFALIVLISSLFIYNTNGNIDEKSISDLALAAHLSNSIATNSIENKDLIISELAPKFIWVLRDFILDKVDPDTGDEISSNEYLELCLKNKSIKNNNSKSIENNLIRENIIKYFHERECVTLPRPVDSEDDLHNLQNIPFYKLKPNFRDEFLNLKRKIYETSKPKKIGHKTLTGPILAELLKNFINSINSKIIPNINTALDNIILNEIDNNFNECLKLWRDNKKNEKFNLQLLYNMKYVIISCYNKLLNENQNIKFNEQYFQEFNNKKSKLENEINKDIEKEKNLFDQKNTNLLRDIINRNAVSLKTKSIIDSFDNYDTNKISKISSCNSTNKDLLSKEIFLNNFTKEENNLFKELKNANLITNENQENIFFEANLEYTKNIVNNLNNFMEKELETQNEEIKEEIKKNEIVIQSFDPKQFKEINSTLNKRFELLSSDLDMKEKEVFSLIGKYTKLMEKRDRIITGLNQKNMQIKVEPNIATMRSQKFKNSGCGFIVESGEKSCGCRMGDVCKIF